ncbi:MAG: FkbM family methyltransferase [Flavobacteriales bacterium]|nr:FkbM family methyltransferase [Flavobacteriales bacterium]
MNRIKDLVRSILQFLHLDLTRNLEYDRLTRKIMEQKVRPGTNCIDVGCHKGEILDIILKQSPNGKHFAFEPIPPLFAELKRKYGQQCTVFPFALSDVEGRTTFNFVRNAPAYSGINKRKYAVAEPDIQEIEVELKRLDDVIPSDIPIGLIKIDVEGAEMGVLRGAKALLNRDRPLVIFECGLGASEFYGTTAEVVFDFFSNDVKMGIFTLRDFIAKRGPMTRERFVEAFNTNSDYYFVAAPLG